MKSNFEVWKIIVESANFWWKVGKSDGKLQLCLGKMAINLYLSWKNQKIRKSTLLHSLFWLSVWKIFPRVIWYFSWISWLEKWRPRNIPRSRAAPSTSKRTSASIFPISISKKNIKLHLEKFSTHFIRTMHEGKYHFYRSKIGLDLTTWPP